MNNTNLDLWIQLQHYKDRDAVALTNGIEDTYYKEHGKLPDTLIVTEKELEDIPRATIESSMATCYTDDYRLAKSEEKGYFYIRVTH